MLVLVYYDGVKKMTKMTMNRKQNILSVNITTTVCATTNDYNKNKAYIIDQKNCITINARNFSFLRPSKSC